MCNYVLDKFKNNQQTFTDETNLALKNGIRDFADELIICMILTYAQLSVSSQSILTAKRSAGAAFGARMFWWFPAMVLQVLVYILNSRFSMIILVSRGTELVIGALIVFAGFKVFKLACVVVISP